MKIEKENKVFKILFDDPIYPKEFVFAESLEEANIIVNKVFAHRKVLIIKEIELCG